MTGCPHPWPTGPGATGGTTVRLRPAAIIGALLLTASLLAAGVPTNAATSAPRCTITGTAGNDRLFGTGGNDVICGFGGDDRIFAGPGQDVVLAGPGADRIAGDRGNDQLSGEGGDDLVEGGRGHDRMIGGGGRDILRGDGGEDRMNGGAGADGLVGGFGHDWLYGGAGADVCPYEPLDNERNSCTYDRERPRLISLTTSHSTVNVTSSSRVVTFRARLVDDAGISEGQTEGWRPYFSLTDYTHYLPYAHFDRVSGTARDGVWQTQVTVPRGMPATTLRASVFFRDVAARVVIVEKGDFLKVTDSNPDTQLPQVQLRAPSAGTVYDVRSEAKPVAVRARITDDYTGVETAWACVLVRSGDQWLAGPCRSAARVSGTSSDGIWQAVIRLPKGSRGGQACIEIGATDRAHPGYQHNDWTCTDAANSPDRAFGGDIGEILIRGSAG